MKKLSLLIGCVVLSIILVSCNGQNVVIPNIGTEGDSPKYLEFDSVDDIRAFVSLLKGEQNEETYKEYLSESYLYAQHIASTINSTQIPYVKDQSILDGFAADSRIYNYNREMVSFDIRYRVDGILYGFAYSYNDRKPAVHEGTPWLKNQTIGTVSFDLYESNGDLYGSFMLDTTEVHVYIYSNRIGDISFEPFEFISLSQTSE